MRVKYTGNGSLSTTYDGITYSFDARERVKDIPTKVYDHMKLSGHTEAVYLEPDFSDLERLQKENEELKKENEALKQEIGKPKKKEKNARRKKAL